VSELAISTPAPTRQQIAAEGRSAPLKVTGKLKVALDAMVWQGMKRAAAAHHAGLKEQSLYVALLRTHVKAYYLSQLEVLRTSERSRNIHRLTEIRDKADNMPAVQAIKMLEQLADEAHGPGASAQRAPGVTVIVMTRADDTRVPNAVQVIDNVEGEQS